jgi:hypothetical protein
MIQERDFDLDTVGRVLCTSLVVGYIVGPVNGASFAEYGRFRNRCDVVDKLRARIVLTVS